MTFEEEKLKEELQSYARMGRLLTGNMWQDYYKRCIKPLEDKLKKIQEDKLKKIQEEE